LKRRYYDWWRDEVFPQLLPYGEFHGKPHEEKELCLGV